MDIIEEPECLRLVFFQDSWLRMSYDDIQLVVVIIKEVMEKLWGSGVPTYIERREGRGRDSVVAR
jgi:hypothetical protein